MCIYAYMHICTDIYMYRWIYVYVYLCVCAYLYKNFAGGLRVDEGPEKGFRLVLPRDAPRTAGPVPQSAPRLAAEAPKTPNRRSEAPKLTTAALPSAPSDDSGGPEPSKTIEFT